MLGELLKQARLQAGLTQKAVADKADISRIALGDIESGRADPKVSTLERIARAIGIDPGDLLNRKAIA